MGSSGKKHPHHLPKVGTEQEIRQEQHLEREAILANFGIDPEHANPVLKWFVIAAILLLAVGGAVSLAFLL